MKNIKVSSNFVNLLKKGVSIGLVVTTIASFTACSNNSYNTGNVEPTSISTTNYQINDLPNGELWVVKTGSNELLSMLVVSKLNSYFVSGDNCWEIRDFKTGKILLFSEEDMPFYLTDEESKEMRKRLENKAVTEFENKFGKIVSKDNLLKLLILKYGQKEEYSEAEIKNVCEARVEEILNKKEETTDKQEVTTVPTTTKVVEQTEKTTVPATTIPANATIDEVAALRHYGEHNSTLTINNKKYRVYDDKKETSEFLVNEETFTEVIPSGKYVDLFFQGHSNVNYAVGLKANGDIDKIYIDKNEKTSVITILKDTDYTSGFVIDKTFWNDELEVEYVPYLYAYSDIMSNSPALINLNTNVVECEADIYSDMWWVGNYSLGIKNNGDVDKIMHNRQTAEIVNVAKNTGYDAIAYSGNNEFILFNQEDGKENGKTYTLFDDQLVLTENVKKKER